MLGSDRLTDQSTIILCGELINHGDNPQQNRAAHPKTAAFDFLAAKGTPDCLSFDDDFDFRAARHLIHEISVNVRDVAEKSMRYQAALDLVSDLAKTGIEFLPLRLVFRGAASSVDHLRP
jgi:hypothetical protein